jgi:hypothetical protein
MPNRLHPSPPFAVLGGVIMPEAYSPIVRSFCRFRAAVRNHVDIARHDVRPETALETLLPFEARREIWQELGQQGLELPPLEFSERDSWRILLRVVKVAVSSAFYLKSWYALLVALPTAPAVFWAGRHRAVHFPHVLKTVGDVVIYGTRFADHKHSGYRWTRNEIALKVRLLVAESAGLPLDAVQPETRFADL